MITQKIYIPSAHIWLPVSKPDETRITLSIADFRDLGGRLQRSHTKTLTVIGTDAVNQKLQHLFDIHWTTDSRVNPVIPSFSPSKKYKAILYENDLEIFSGYIRIREIASIGGVLEYRMVMFSDIVDKFKEFETKTLKEIDYSEYTHQLTHSNVDQSQRLQIIKNNSTYYAIAGGIPKGEGYLYPLMFYGERHQTYNSTGQGTPHEPDDRFNITRLPLWFFVRELFIKVFNSVGITVTGNFINSEIFKRLVISGDLNLFTADNSQLNQALASVTPNLNKTLQAIQSQEWNGNYVKRFWFLNDTIYPIVGATINSGTIIAPSTGWIKFIHGGKYRISFNYQVSVNVDLTNVVSVLYSYAVFQVKKVGGAVVKNENIAISVNSSNTINVSLDINAQPNDVYEHYLTFYIRLDKDTTYQTDSSPLADKDYQIISNSGTISTQRLDEKTNYGMTINPSHYLPDMKCSEFVQGIQRMFNLVFSDIVDGTMTVDPAVDFYQYTGIDWTEKVDQSKPIVVKPTASELAYRNARYLYSHAEDMISSNYISQTQEGYGDGNFSIDNELATGDIEVKIPFQLVAPVKNAYSNLTYPHVFGLEGGQYKPIKTNPIIGLYTTYIHQNSYLHDYDFNTNSIINTTMQFYAQILHYDSDSTPTIGIEFKTPKVLYYNPTKIHLNNIFFKYHHPLLQEYLSDEGKLLKLFVHIKLNEITDKSLLKKIILIDGVPFRINQIKDWTSLTSSVEVELIKVTNVRKNVNLSDVAVGIDSSTYSDYRVAPIGQYNGIDDNILTIDRSNILRIGGLTKRIASKFFYARISQAATDPPTVTDVYNVDLNLSFNRLAAGLYEITSATPDFVNYFAWIAIVGGSTNVSIYKINANTLRISTTEDNQLDGNPLIIEIY